MTVGPGRPRGGGGGLLGAGAVDLAAALSELRERGETDEAHLVALLERAVADTYHRLVPDDPGVRASVDLLTGNFELVRPRATPPVDEDAVEDGEPAAAAPRAPEQSTLDHVDPPSADFARQAAMAARAAVAGLIRDVDAERVLREADARRGELVDAIVEREDGPICWLMARTLPVMLPPEEQIPGENLDRGRHLKLVLVDARRRGRDAVAVGSRSHPDVLRRLLEQEVPELASGQVTIRALVREPGRRSKVAVEATQAGIDPVGACIGPKGVRIRQVVSELGEEQVQVIAWSQDQASYVANALQPATVRSVQLDEESRTAHVVVPANQLSLAIGRSGENARLAARLTRWRIDIDGEGEAQ
ncbi:MAG TPA: transcription termination factor NusA [Candidatus Dormibacteraeota bacterium]|jgi:N utilization substance protein A|nr:transcription termination factor NusA [Candidatus Dormibacteraeota bacterium]